ncbi:MAG: TIGR02147 family protein [Proteobacteria bacterium]|nr:MAG: TIGR02147 family protein [Pseudomonadota bacterium]
MQAQAAVQHLLRKRFAEAKSTNPGYSLRAYARKLGVHVGSLTYIINGKRNVSKKLAERLAGRLALDPQARAELLGLFPQRQKKRAGAVEIATSRYLEVNAAQFRMMSEWEHLGVLSLSKCDDFQGDTSWIAGRLGISEARSRAVTERLISLNLLSRAPDGTIIRTAESIRTSDDVAELSIRQHHDENLTLAKESLHRDPVLKRDFTSITLAIDPKKLNEAKERIRTFTDELCDFLESGERTEVFRISTQLFPLTKDRDY